MRSAGFKSAEREEKRREGNGKERKGKVVGTSNGVDGIVVSWLWMLGRGNLDEFGYGGMDKVGGRCFLSAVAMRKAASIDAGFSF